MAHSLRRALSTLAAPLLAVTLATIPAQAADTPAWNPQYDGTVKISSIQTYNKDWWHRFNGYTTKYGYFELRAKNSAAGGGGHQAPVAGRHR